MWCLLSSASKSSVTQSSTFSGASVKATAVASESTDSVEETESMLA